MFDYKKIASNYLIELKGKEWLSKYKEDLCCFSYENDSKVIITFCLISMLPSEKTIIENSHIDFQPNGSISFEIDKKTKEAKVYKNLLP